MAMNSDPTRTPKSSPSKLPIKRKTPPNSFASSSPDSPIAVHGGCSGDDPSPPPFKFHRIWTESDEIRFLQCLLECTAENLSFPRDLNVFYTRFSSTMSQPYTKSQLSEKLRRLRKKFRVISSRLAKGRDVSMLSPHDRALYDISKQLWHPDFAASYSSVDNPRLFGAAIAKVVVDVFDECLTELREELFAENSNPDDSFEKGVAESFEERWRKQRVEELDVFSKRMRLVLEHE